MQNSVKDVKPKISSSIRYLWMKERKTEKSVKTNNGFQFSFCECFHGYGDEMGEGGCCRIDQGTIS